MNEQVGRKRDWIKNAVIVFLTIMLVLTFFSNTIMNYSLPEVSAQYVTSGTLQAKVRGSGTVVAGDPYSVKAESTKEIISVAVKNGDHVEKGDVLLYLEEGESTELKEAQAELDKRLSEYKQNALAANIDPETTNNILNGKFTDFSVYHAQVDALKKEISDLEYVIDLYNTEIEKVKIEQSQYDATNDKTPYDQLQDIIYKNQKYVGEQQEKLSEKNDELSAVLAKLEQENTMSAALDEITALREKISKLKNNTDEESITAPVAGTVQDLYLIAGESTTASEAVATILPDGKGYSMEVTVTKEQAQKLSVGDVADIQNSWYYSNVAVVLQQIKASKEDPANKKVLVFKVEGDVSNGQSLSISIGQKSANYDCIVPNSAVREDNNGKFVLIVSQKSSPLGNRYYAERVDIEVLGSDDTQSAVKGALQGYEFVITTSTKPVEAGQLIRLAD